MQDTSSSRSGTVVAIATLLAILATLSINVFSNFFPPQGLNIGEIANTILAGVKITPANYAFSIWGLIYLGLIAYGFYQLQPSQRHNPTIQQVDIFLITACVAQIVWVYLFTLQQFWLSVVAIAIILLALIGAYLKLDIGNHRVSRSQRWLAQVPLSIYLGWIAVATIVNVASALYISGWTGGGISATAWTVVMLIVGTILAAIVAIQRRDLAFTLVFIWAYVAIAIRQGQEPAIWITAIVDALILGVLLTVNAARHR